MLKREEILLEGAEGCHWLQWLLWGSVFIIAINAVIFTCIAIDGAILPLVAVGLGMSFVIAVAVTAISFIAAQAVDKITNMVKKLCSSNKSKQDN